MAYGYIYETTNLLDGTKYIGKRETLKDIDTYLGSGTHFKNALNKYGRENFKKRILCFYGSKKELGDAEKYFIAVYRHFYGRDGIYNIADGGEGGGHPQTEDTKSKISASRKGKPLSEETKKKQSEAHKGKRHTEETKKKQSDSLKGEKNPMYGKGYLFEGGKHPRARKVNQYDLQGNFIREWETISQAAKELNISKGNISSCCRGECNKAGGFIWRLKI